MDRRTFLKVTGLAGMDLSASHMGIRAEAQAAQQKAQRGGAWGRYLLGAAYYPEWWPHTEWETDFREMHELGINTVRMGEFAWALFEPEEGKFCFEWMDHAIAVANHYEIGVILGTPTASVPPWLYQLHPDVLSGNDNGLYTYGGRKGYCTSSQNYLAASARIVTALADHYGHHAGVIGWQLDNEPGFPFQSYDPISEHAFQAWLQKRYGSLKELNRAWNGAFWSNEYSDWSQIRFPKNSAEGGWQPAINLAYREFFSDSFLHHLCSQAEILRSKTENQFIFTNWPAPTWSVDVFAAAEFLDATAWDNYVSAPGLSQPHRQYTSGFFSDFCRCAGPHQRFLCAEQNAYVPPNALHDGLRLQAYMDFAHGSRGHLYFEWRRPLAGGEQHRPSFIKGFDGAMNPAKQTLQQICKELSHLGPRLAEAVTHADIALLYDFPNEWAQGMGGIGDKNPRYNGEAQCYYNGLKVLQHDIDVVPVSADYSQYKLIVASNLRLIDDHTVERLRAFVANGGTLALNYRAATQNMDNSMRRTLAPGPFSDMAGVKSEAMLDLVEYNPEHGTFDRKLESELGISFTGDNASFKPRTIVESLVLHGAEPIAFVHSGHMDGKPVVTRNRHGQGWVFYAGVDCMEDEFYEALARAMGKTAGLTPLIDAPYDVEVVSRRDAQTTFYFLLNLTEAEHKNIVLPHPMDDLINDRKNISRISLGPLDVAVLASQQ